jgi:hypothetical protein
MSKRCCQNCMYAMRPKSRWLRVILTRFPGLLICFNKVGNPGRMEETCSGHVCRNFRPRHWKRGARHTPPCPPDSNTRLIPLTHGEVAMVDAEDFEELSKYKWSLARGRYAVRREKGKTILMHRVIMKPPDGMVVDHFDGNGLNNRRSNLRICTPQQNNYNSRPRGGSSAFKGVSYVKRRGKFKAVVGHKGKKIQIGE